MARPVSITVSGGRPVSNVADLDANRGVPVTPVDPPIYGEPVTLIDVAGGAPVTLVNEDGTLWSGIEESVARSQEDSSVRNQEDGTGRNTEGT